MMTCVRRKQADTMLVGQHHASWLEALCTLHAQVSTISPLETVEAPK